jgi:Fe-Mn family superoxide dismutase
MTHWTRRQLLQTAGAGVATLALAPLASLTAPAQEKSKTKGFTLPPLPYAEDALEPSIDALTMKIHHDRHHAAYVAGLNKALAGHPKLLAMDISELLRDIKSVPGAIRTAVRNSGGGHSNHTIFWQIMGPKAGGSPTGALAKAIDKRFGSFDKFKKQLSEAAVTRFGSGWAWLVLNRKGGLQVTSRANQDSPYMDGMRPLLGIDVWEHAYYLKYKNERAKYVAAWWNVVNWKEVADRYGRLSKETGA